MSEKTTALERLERLLNEKDAELEQLRRENERLTNRHEGEFGGLLDHDEIEDDLSLPIPRLEIVHLAPEDKDWRDQRVIYRIVYKHLTGKVVSVPLGATRIRGGVNEAPKDR